MSKEKYRLEEIVNSIRHEIFPVPNRQEFLASCACQRIQEKNSSYNMYFDHYLQLIENSEGNTNDLARTGNILRSLSKTVTSSYIELMKVIDQFSTM